MFCVYVWPVLAHVHVHKGCYLAVRHLHTGGGGEEPPSPCPPGHRSVQVWRLCQFITWPAPSAEAPSTGALGPVSSTKFRLLLFHLFLDLQFVEISHVLNGLLPISFIIMSCAF